MTALDSYLKDKRAELSELKKERRLIKSGNKLRLDTPIEELEKQIRKYMKSRMDPRRVGHIIINYKLYEQFLKKITNFETRTVLHGDCLKIQYGHKQNVWVGTLTLIDLSEELGKYENIQEVDIDYYEDVRN